MKTLILLSLLFLSTVAFAEKSDLSKMLEDTKMVPHIENGNVVGYRLAEVKKGSQWEKMGFKKGDIVEVSNEQLIDSPAEALKLYNELKESGSTQIERKRIEP